MYGTTFLGILYPILPSSHTFESVIQSHPSMIHVIPLDLYQTALSSCENEAADKLHALQFVTMRV